MTHTPRFILLVLVLALTGLATASSAHARLFEPAPTHGELTRPSARQAAVAGPRAAVRRAVGTYLQARAAAAVARGSAQALRRACVPNSPLAEREALTALGDLLIHEQMGDYPAVCVSHVLDESITVNGSQARSEVTEDTEMSFSARSRRSSTEGGVLHHGITLCLCHGTWLVTGDIYQDDGAETYLRAASAPQALIRAAHRRWLAQVQTQLRAQAAQGWLAVALSSIPSPATADVSSPPTADGSSPPITPLGLAGRPYKARFVYRRAAAVAYALRWFSGHNSYYNSYDGQGGDCANFVSQCLGDEPPAPAPNGGQLWRFGSASDPLSHQWWFQRAPYRQQSQSWTFCPTQSDAWRWPQPGRSPASYVCTYTTAVPTGYAPGDVVWLTDASGALRHAMICTSFSGSTPLFTCHSPGVHDKPRSCFGWASQRYARVVDTVTVL
jgi:hypothetical protein